MQDVTINTTFLTAYEANMLVIRLGLMDRFIYENAGKARQIAESIIETLANSGALVGVTVNQLCMKPNREAIRSKIADLADSVDEPVIATEPAPKVYQDEQGNVQVFARSTAYLVPALIFHNGSLYRVLYDQSALEFNTMEEVAQFVRSNHGQILKVAERDGDRYRRAQLYY